MMLIHYQLSYHNYNHNYTIIQDDMFINGMDENEITDDIAELYTQQLEERLKHDDYINHAVANGVTNVSLKYD